MTRRSALSRAAVRAAAIAALVAGLAPGVARGDEPAGAEATPSPSQSIMEEARAHYARGVKLYTEGSLEGALVELDRANQLAPSYKILYSIGLVKLRLADFAGAQTSFEGYLAAGGTDVPGARRKEVADRLAEIATRVATADVVVAVSDADVMVDDLAVGKTPLARPLRLNPGYHRIGVSKTGYAGETRQVGFAGGDTIHLELQLTPIVAPPPVAPVPAPPPPPPLAVEPSPASASTPSSSPLVSQTAGPRPLWIGWAVTGALAVGAMASGVAALGQSSKLGDQIHDQPTPQSDIAATQRTTTTLALTCDILAGAAIVAGVTTLYFTLTSRKRPSATAPLVLGPGGVSGRF